MAIPTSPDVASARTFLPTEVRPRSPLRRLTGVRFLGTGSYLPDPIVDNAALSQLGFDSDWILQRTGIRERRHAGPQVATSDMATHAAERCLRQAGVAPSDVDLVLVATMTPDSPVPSAACRVQERLGISGPAFDLNAACAGFVYALITGMQFVKAGTSRCALVIGADTNSKIVNPDDKKTYPLFGDGAGAVLLGPAPLRDSSTEPTSAEGTGVRAANAAHPAGGGNGASPTGPCGALAYTLGADGAGAHLLCIPGGGSRIPPSTDSIAQGLHFIHMDGRPVFKWAVRVLHDTVSDVLEHAQVRLDEVDLFVFHQANLRIIEAAIQDLGLPRDRVIINLDRYGNTSAGSIPLCLDEARATNRLRPGHKVLISGFGAGLAWGTALLGW